MAHLKLASKIRADKRSRVSTDPALSFEVFSLPQGHEETFDIYKRLSSSFAPPVLESYQKILARRLKNFSGEDASLLLKLVLSVLICPINQDPAMTSKFFENENRLLKRMFGAYLSATTIDATIIGFRDREHDVIEELRSEIELTKGGEHPLYPKHDFESDEDFRFWQDARLVELNHKLKQVEKQPSFGGKLTVSVLQAQGLDANGERGEPTSSSIYFMVKVAEQSNRSVQYVNGTWNPVFQPEPFTFDVPSRDCRIKIELWDKNFIGSTFLGCVMAKPKDLMWIDQPCERWWNLGSRTRTKDTGVTGQLLVRFNLSFRIGPYRPEPTSTPTKSPFSSIFSSSSTTPNPPTSASSSSLSKSHGHLPKGSIVPVNDPNHDDFTPSTRGGSLGYDGSSGYGRHAEPSQNPQLVSSADSDSLPAPPPIVNSHLNNYPEWYSSLLMIALLDSAKNPPPSAFDAMSDAGSSSSTGSSSNSAQFSAPTLTPSIPVSPLITVGTPSRHSPAISITGGASRAGWSAESSGTNSRAERRGSREIGGYGDMNFALTFDDHSRGESPSGVGPSYGVLAPIPHSQTHLAHGTFGTGMVNSNSIGQMTTPGVSGSPSTRSMTPNAPLLGDSPRDASYTRSTGDLLSSSSGSLSRSAPSIRQVPMRAKTVGLKSLTSGTGSGHISPMGSLEEEEEMVMKTSVEVQWLLDQFVERFSIDSCLSPLLMIEVLDQSYNVRSLSHLEAIYAALVEFESSKNVQPLRWAHVLRLYEHVICESLKSHLDDSLSNYFTWFPRNEPKGALNMTILLYSLVTKFELPQLCVFLHDKIESTMIKMYKVVIGEKITETSLLDATRFVSQVVDLDNRFFNEVFPSDLMLTSFSVRTYYLELLAKNIKAWLRTSPPITESTMILYGYLGRLNSQILRFQPAFDLMTLQSMFQPFVGKWIEHVGENMPHWCRYDLLRKETWRSVASSDGSHPLMHSSSSHLSATPQSLSVSSSIAPANGSSCILHSVSVQILFEAFNRTYNQYRQFDMRTPKDLKALVKIFVATIQAYIQVMATKAVETFAVQGAPKGVSMGGGRNSPSMRHSPSSRFRANSAGDVYAMASASGTNPSSVPPSLSSTGSSSVRYGSSSGSIWTMFGIIPTNQSKQGKLLGGDHARGLFHIPIESCVWISTIETLTQKLYEFCKQLVADGEKGADDARGWFGDTFSQLQTLQAQISQLIIKLINTNPSLELALDTLLSYSPDVDKITDSDVRERLEPLFDYLNSRIDTLSSHLDNKVLIRLLEQIWLVLVKDIEVLLFPVFGDRKADAKRAQFIEYALPFLISFLEGKDGDGLAPDFLEGESMVLKSAFAMLKVPTGVLCKAYTDITNGLAPTGIPGSEGIDLMTLESHVIAVLSMRKNDKEAKKFVKTNKDHTMDRLTLRAFDLPKGETVVDWFTCRKGKECPISGYLFVTTNWLCFDTYLWGDHQISIPLSELRSLKRKKTTLSTNGITIRLRDGQTTIQFTALNKIKAYDVIVDQATKMGCVLDTYDKNETDSNGGSSSSISREDSPGIFSTVQSAHSGHKRSASSSGSYGGSLSSSPSKKSLKESLPREVFGDALKVEGAKHIENEDDMKSHFGLSKYDEAIVAFDCALTLESKDKGTLGSANHLEVGIMYCFTRHLCFRSAHHKIVHQWGHVTHLGQRGTEGILIVVKEKKKSKQVCLTKFQAPDDVFALLHSIWVSGRGS